MLISQFVHFPVDQLLRYSPLKSDTTYAYIINIMLYIP